MLPRLLRTCDYALVELPIHAPRVVSGCELNLLTMGLARQISAAVDGSGRPRMPHSSRVG